MGLPTQKKLSLLPVFCSSTSLTILLILCPNLFKLFPPEKCAKNTNSAASPYLTPWSCPSRRWCVLVTSSPPAGDALDLAITNWSISQPINTTNLSITNKIFRLGHNIHLQIGKVGLEIFRNHRRTFLGVGETLGSFTFTQPATIFSLCMWLTLKSGNIKLNYYCL